MKNTIEKKRSFLLRTLLLMTILYFGTGTLSVKAAQTTVSHGNLIYEDGRGSACLYAADIRLLEEKISSIPETCFDPLCYAHTHHWEYRDINEDTHTRHCADCGEANDLTSAHRAERWERDILFYEGKSYSAKRYTCACGYQWRMELTHNLIYETVDEIGHRGRCALDGTPYCTGYEPSEEEHYAWYYEMSDDDLHHTRICFDCGFQTEEDCCFIEDEDGDGPPACVCGRTKAEEAPDIGEESETPDEIGTEDKSDGPVLPDAEEAPDEPDTEAEPKELALSDTESKPDAPDRPGTSDTAETPDSEKKADAATLPDGSGKTDTSNTLESEDKADTPNISESEGKTDTAVAPESKDRADTPGTNESEDASAPPTTPQTGQSRASSDEIVIIDEYIELIPLY